MRNRRNLFEAQKEKRIRDLINADLSENKEYILSRPAQLNKVDSELLSDNRFPYSAGEASSVSKESDLRYKALSDIETCINMLDEKIEYVSTAHRAYMNAFEALRNEYKEIEKDANRNILLSLRDDPFSYGYTDDFTSYRYVDFLRSTTNVIKDKVTLGAKRVKDIDLPIARVQTRISSRSGSVQSINELSDSYNVYHKDGSSFKVEIEASNSSTFVELELMLELSVETSIDKLSVVARSIESNDSESIMVSYSKDGRQFLSPELSDMERLENMTNLFDIYDTDIKYVKVRLQKRAADITTRFKNQYIFSIDYIGAIEYEFETESTFYSKGYPILDEDGNPVNFTMASLETGTCCLTPNETSISFYLSKDGENYIPANYFGESGATVEFSNQINRSIFVRQDEQAGDLISFDEGTWLINNYIPNAESYIEDSLVIKRNLNAWNLDGNQYEAYIDIDNPEGMFFDLGTSTCQVNDVFRTGRFFLPQGTHKIRTKQYLKISDNLASEALLTSRDSLYPYNHKYIFEGYKYPHSFTGDKVYVGASRVYETKLRKVSRNFFVENTDKRDIFYIASSSAGDKFYIHKTTFRSQEEIYLDCRTNDSIIDNKIYIKAVLRSDNQFKSPRIDSVQVRVI